MIYDSFLNMKHNFTQVHIGFFVIVNDRKIFFKVF